MESPVGQKGAVKRAVAFLGEPVDGATQVESAGGVTSTIVTGAALGGGAGLARLLGRRLDKAQSAKDQRESEAGTQLLAVPRHALLAVTATYVHFLPASDIGRIPKDAVPTSVPLSEVARVDVEERKITTSFRLTLTSGAVLAGETKRIGANRHNLEVLRLLQDRAAARPQL